MSKKFNTWNIYIFKNPFCHTTGLLKQTSKKLIKSGGKTW